MKRKSRLTSAQIKEGLLNEDPLIRGATLLYLVLKGKEGQRSGKKHRKNKAD